MNIKRFLQNYITASRNQYALQLKTDPRYWSLSAINYHYHKDILQITRQNKFGNLLDAGAGGLNGKVLFSDLCDSYTSLDIIDRTDNIDIIGDVQNMEDIKENSFDTVYSSQVLEHVPYPALAIKEFKRVLNKSGLCIISVPHLSHYHEIPYDFFRFTEFGISKLLEDAGFSIMLVKKQGGIVSFITHPLSVILITLCWQIPILKWVGFYLNKFILVLPSYYIDKISPASKVYPCNLLVIASADVSR